MKTQKINFYICLLILAIGISGSACSLAKINAQSPNQETARREPSKPARLPTPAYKEPKRVSRDVIKPEKPESTVKTKLR